MVCCFREGGARVRVRKLGFARVRRGVRRGLGVVFGRVDGRSNHAGFFGSVWACFDFLLCPAETLLLCGSVEQVFGIVGKQIRRMRGVRLKKKSLLL